MRTNLGRPIRPDYSLLGRRVRLERCTDPHTRLRPGQLGTVALVDDLGTVHVRWDDGHSLGLIAGEDEWTILEAAPGACPVHEPDDPACGETDLCPGAAR